MRYRRSASSGRDRGIVLVMVITILVTIAIAGTAFVVFMREANQASSNVYHRAQAELAARSGMEHAIRVIEEAVHLYVSPVYTSPTGDVTPARALDPSTGNVSEENLDPATTKDDGAEVGWYGYFHHFDPAEMETIISYDTDEVDPAKHYVIRGRKFGLYYPTTLPLTSNKKRGEYTVYVEDLDGKLHANIARWTGGLPRINWPANLPAIVALAATSADEEDITSTQTNLLGPQSGSVAFSSQNEFARRGAITDATKGKYALEKYFTVYPVLDHGITGSYEQQSSDFTQEVTDPVGTTEITLSAPWSVLPGAAAGCVIVFEGSPVDAYYGVEDNTGTTLTVVDDCTGKDGERFGLGPPRAAMNVNTAPEELVSIILQSAGSLVMNKDKAAALAKHLCATRPFANHHELEEAVRRVTGEDAVKLLSDYDAGLTGDERYLEEQEFNDVLNNAAPAHRGMIQAEAKAQSAYDDPDKPGVYEIDRSPFFTDTIGPSQTGGVRAQTVPKNVTWSTEFKFTSRFFHIYVLGRGWNPGAGEGQVAGVCRLHAIYDAAPTDGSPGRIVWMRWNLSSRGSVTDMRQSP